MLILRVGEEMSDTHAIYCHEGSSCSPMEKAD